MDPLTLIIGYFAFKYLDEKIDKIEQHKIEKDMKEFSKNCQNEEK